MIIWGEDAWEMSGRSWHDESNDRLTSIAKTELTRGHTKLLDVACQLWSSSIPIDN